MSMEHGKSQKKISKKNLRTGFADKKKLKNNFLFILAFNINYI